MVRRVQIGKVVLMDRKICSDARVDEERGAIFVLARPVQWYLNDTDRQIVAKFPDLR